MSTSIQVIAIGELLWDVFPNQQRLGGAPANFAIHYAQLSGDNHAVALVSAVGAHPTGKVIVTTDSNGSPSYEIAADVAWDYLAGGDAVSQAASNAQAICFGTLAQRSPMSRTVIQETVSATVESALRVLDINLRPTMTDPEVFQRSLEIANVLKLSDEELPVLAKQFALTGDYQSQLDELRQRFDLTTIAYTCGEHGAILLHGDEISHCTGVPTDVVDTVGAGDAFTAALVAGLLEQKRVRMLSKRGDTKSSRIGIGLIRSSRRVWRFTSATINVHRLGSSLSRAGQIGTPYQNARK